MTKKLISPVWDDTHYTADAFLLTCIDDRFTNAITATEKEHSWHFVDSVKWAGAAKELAKSDASELSATGKALLEQITISIKLHHTKEIVLSIHEACGAYGDGMPKDHAAALSFMESELKKTGAIVKKYLSDGGMTRPVRLLAYAFDGVYEIE